MTRPDPGLEQQASVRTFLRVGGAIILVIGVLLTLAAMASFFSAFGSFSGPPRNFWMAFIGLPMIAIGIGLTKAGYLGPASRYVAGEVTPTLRDTLGAVGFGSAAHVCVACGTANDADSRFCDKCGTPMRIACPACATDNDADASFCDSCGSALRA